EVRPPGFQPGSGSGSVVRAAMPEHQQMPCGPGPCLPGPVISPPPGPPGPVYSRPLSPGPAIGPTFPAGPGCCDEGGGEGAPAFYDRFGCGDGVTQGYNNLFYANADYLLYWFRGQKVPPLVTSGALPTVIAPGVVTNVLPAALGQQSTSILFGGSSV